MGVVNITPDSFSDGGVYYTPHAAIDQSKRLIEEGADIIDLGGQSTRPGSQPIGAEEELNRVLPVLKAIRKESSPWISIDTYRSEVASVCIAEGADLINDVSSFRMDAEMAPLLAKEKIPVVCMHFLESIHPMPENPQYTNLFAEILEFFEQTFRIAHDAGIDMNQMIVDPGIGFGKTLQHNLQILNHLDFLNPLNRPVLVGPSRKSFIGKITGLPASERLEGTAAAVAAAISGGGHIIRVHDAVFFRRFCDVLDQILNS
jgi:dihydropteroate synthase